MEGNLPATARVAKPKIEVDTVGKIMLRIKLVIVGRLKVED